MPSSKRGGGEGRVEGTGSFGAGIARHLTALGIERVEVDRPDQVTGGARARTTTWTRSMRRRPLRGQRTSVPKSKDGTVETLPVLRATHTTAVKACRVALQILR